MTLTAQPNEQRFFLDGVAWKTYEDFLRGLDNRHVFLTYDDGRMELMSPSWRHDRSAELIATIVRLYALETGIPIAGGGSTTFKRRDLRKGLEPDRCFYVRNESKVRGKEQIDLKRDPPPDLAIEVEISERLLDRIGIYAVIGVRELWRFDGRRLSMEVLRRGRYSRVERSTSLPNLLPEQVTALLERSRSMDETTWMRMVAHWMHENLPKRK